MPRFGHSLLVCSVVLACATRVHAQANAQRPPVTGGESIDLVTGPVQGSGRVIGLGGAYTALAPGIDGAAWTPAAYVTRSLWELNWFEADVTADLSPGTTLANTDFDNNGKTGFRYSDFLFLTLGARAELGEFGIGSLVRVQNYNVGDNAALRLVIANYGVGYMFLDGQLMVGFGARTAALQLVDAGSLRSLVSFVGTGPEVGALLALEGKPYRFGLSARLAVSSTKDDSSRVAAGLTLPHELVLPAEVQAGFAYQLGSRPLNQRFTNPHDVEKRLRDDMLRQRAARKQAELERERTAARLHTESQNALPIWSDTDDDAFATEAEPIDPDFWLEEERIRKREERELSSALEADHAVRKAEVAALSRRYLLISSEAILIGSVQNGIGLESFLSQRQQTSGDKISLGLRLGLEGEPIAGWVKARLGSYYEPSRFAGVSGRVHGTFGFDVRMFRWNLFGLLDDFDTRIGASIDLSSRYSNFGFGFGLWH